ncbi:MAG: 7-carboxy-7-deazaguanine synthase QueE [Bacteroidaceae bacterium]|nr:7-carboxy-7-deazaguanine synthase QueE [Bacteroidaceae bacterium]
MRRVNEIFYSLQGEGMHTGEAAVFIRFCGCNLKCPFCDTDFSQGEEMSDEEILSEVNKYPSRLVVLTGGEPTLSVDRAFVQLLKDNGRYVAMETNGTHQAPENLDWVTVSPKFEYVGEKGKLVEQRIDELKVVYSLGTDVSRYTGIPAKHYLLQPCDTGDKKKNEEIIVHCVAYILAHPAWKLSLQTQKILNVR